MTTGLKGHPRPRSPTGETALSTEAGKILLPILKEGKMDLKTRFLIGVGAAACADGSFSLSPYTIEARVLGVSEGEIREAERIAVKVRERPDQIVEAIFSKPLAGG
jgi:alkylhydroperoxidase/carboxymuconolactone decarboxylase family protein YurZ